MPPLSGARRWTPWNSWNSWRRSRRESWPEVWRGAWLAALVLVVGVRCDATYDRFPNGLLSLLPSVRPSRAAIAAAKTAAPDLFVDMAQRVRAWGYPLETHTVRTEDGYLLTLHRVPHGRLGASRDDPPGAAARPPVLLQHGIIACSEQWVVTGPGVSPALTLADQGYDVWMNNIRGNEYSKKHEKMETRNPRFWNFSWHEMGLYDVPAAIDHVLNVTKQEKLFYVGHSMGNTVFMVAMSLRPEYNAKVRLLVALAPSVYFDGGVSPPLRVAAANADYLKILLDALPTYEVLRKTDAFIALSHELCSDGAFYNKLSAVVLSWVVGAMDLNNTTQLSLQMARGISSTSALVPWHFTQILRSGDFRQLDLGARENVRRFGAPVPPEYPLRAVTAPAALYVSDGDFLVSTKGTKRLAKALPNVVSLHVIHDEMFNHLSFLLHPQVNEKLMNHVLDVMKRF